MKYLDFFAGIGGFHSAFSRVGWECLGYCEIDRFARQSYQAIHDTEGVEEWHDITAVTNEHFRTFRGRVDLISGGFPCQAFSVAGRQLGFEDTRGTLFFEIARAAKEIQPRYLLLENVKNLISHDKGNTFGTILNTLHELGYAHIEWGIFNSKYWGVPQNRERVFILAELRDEPTEPYLLPLLRQQEENGVGSRLRDVLEDDVDEKYYLSEDKTSKLIEALEDRVKVKEATKKGYAEAFPGDSVNLSQPNSKTRRGRVGHEKANTLLTGQEQAVLEPLKEILTLGHHPFSSGDVCNDALASSRFIKATVPSTVQTILDGSRIKAEPHIDSDDPVMVGRIDVNGHDYLKRVYGINGVSNTLCTMQGGGQEPKIVEPAVSCLNVWKRDGNQTSMQNRVYDSEDLSVALTSFAGRLNITEMKNEVRATLTPDRLEKRQNGRRFKDNDEPMFTLTAQDKHGVAIEEPRINVIGNIKPEGCTRHGQRDDVYGTYGLMGTLNASDYKQPRTVFGLDTSYRIRKLTPLECWRLQDFTDEQFEMARADGISDSQLYKQAGNSVTVKVVEVIAKQIQSRL